MSYQSFYKYSALVLLLINLGLLVFIYIGRTPPPPRNGEKINAKEILKLNDSQNDQFKEIVKIHHARIDSIKNAQGDFLLNYFAHSDTSTENVTNLNQICLLEILKIMEVSNHFSDIEKIIRPEQQSNFQLFRENVIKSFTNPHEKTPIHRRN